MQTFQFLCYLELYYLLVNIDSSDIDPVMLCKLFPFSQQRKMAVPALYATHPIHVMCIDSLHVHK